MLYGKASCHLVYQDGLLTGCFYFHKKSQCFGVVNVFGKLREFLAAAFELASVGIDTLVEFVFLRLVSGPTIFCGSFLK